MAMRRVLIFNDVDLFISYLLYSYLSLIKLVYLTPTYSCIPICTMVSVKNKISHKLMYKIAWCIGRSTLLYFPCASTIEYHLIEYKVR